MGFDDQWFDDELDAQILKLIEDNQDAFTYYCEPLKSDNKNKVINFITECEDKPCYNGYSTAFHMLWGALSCVGRGGVPPGWKQPIQRWKERVRAKLLSLDIYKDMFDEGVYMELSQKPFIHIEKNE